MGPARILIIDNDKNFNKQLADQLRGQGFNICQHYDGQMGLLTALSEKFNLILINVMLPTLDGFSVLNRLRKTSQTPVILMTACNSEAERIEGYRRGADDYFPKTFSFREVLLRIEALLRRAMGSMSATLQKREIRVDHLHLNRPHQQVFYASQPVTLTPIQFRLLWVLVEHRNEVLSKPYLYQMVLERVFSRDDRSLDMHLSRIRRKLVNVGMSAERLTTIHGKGYKFA